MINVPSLPLISILIPVFNMGEFVETAIQSVTNGKYENVEILVLDDGSTDNTRLVVEHYTSAGREKYDTRVKYLHKENAGKSSALNLGLAQYQGDYLVILDADDELCAQSLQCRLAEAIRLVDKSCLIIGGFEVFESKETLGQRPAPKKTSPIKLSRKFYFSMKTPFHLNACLISRPLINEVGEFDERLIRCQDGDYAIRCLQVAEHVEIIDQTVYRYRKHRSSKKDRVRFRIRTAMHRTQVLRKNFHGPMKLVMLVGCMGMDMLKLSFELFGNFKR